MVLSSTLFTSKQVDYFRAKHRYKTAFGVSRSAVRVERGRWLDETTTEVGYMNASTHVIKIYRCLLPQLSVSWAAPG